MSSLKYEFREGVYYTYNRKHHILRNGKPTGYYASRGDYVGDPENDADKWYLEDTTSDTLRRGRGAYTLAKLLSIAGDWFETGMP